MSKYIIDTEAFENSMTAEVFRMLKIQPNEAFQLTTLDGTFRILPDLIIEKLYKGEWRPIIRVNIGDFITGRYVIDRGPVRSIPAGSKAYVLTRSLLSEGSLLYGKEPKLEECKVEKADDMIITVSVEDGSADFVMHNIDTGSRLFDLEAPDHIRLFIDKETAVKEYNKEVTRYNIIRCCNKLPSLDAYQLDDILRCFVTNIEDLDGVEDEK